MELQDSTAEEAPSRQPSPAPRPRSQVCVCLCVCMSHLQRQLTNMSVPSCCWCPQVPPDSRGLIRAVNSYAGFTDFDRSPALLHPDSCELALLHTADAGCVRQPAGVHMSDYYLTLSAACMKRDRSRASAEDLCSQEPRTAVMVSTALLLSPCLWL